MWTRPAPDECGAEYARPYFDHVPDGDLPEIAEAEFETLKRLVAPVSDPAASRGYAPGKWSLKEVVGHVADVERIMATRALRFARGDDQPLPGMDQDPYVAAAGHNRRSLDSMLDELEGVRRASTSLMRSFDDEALDRRGVASGHVFTVRALCYHVVGHATHHRRVIEERYLPPR